MSNEGQDFNAYAAAGTADMVARLAARMKQALSDMRQRHRLREEIGEMERNGGLDSLLADVGLTRGDVDAVIAGFPESGRLLQAMAERLQVDYDSIKDAAIRFELQRTCTMCSTRGRCRTWLRSAETEGYRDFCPNGARFDELRGHAAAP
ncbi:MAG TPA: DUF6455 family protein [Candidatus Binataceae bacterium]|nr:DUF6455 family protein [Candidatus Binataceae bacterium]